MFRAAPLRRSCVRPPQNVRARADANDPHCDVRASFCQKRNDIGGVRFTTLSTFLTIWPALAPNEWRVSRKSRRFIKSAHLPVQLRCTEQCAGGSVGTPTLALISTTAVTSAPVRYRGRPPHPAASGIFMAPSLRGRRDVIGRSVRSGCRSARRRSVCLAYRRAELRSTWVVESDRWGAVIAETGSSSCCPTA